MQRHVVLNRLKRTLVYSMQAGTEGRVPTQLAMYVHQGTQDFAILYISTNDNESAIEYLFWGYKSF